ncbi:MAG: Fic family protein [Lachnospiraceae bacterium]
MSAATAFIPFLLDRFQIEWKRRDRSGVYGFTQRLMAYNSNKIEGSTLTEEQTASLFDTGTLPKSDDYYRAKDVEEMNGHFLMFNKMLETLDQPLSQDLIKQFHYELKSGVFEDRANGYAIGDYKKRPNIIGMYETVLPSKVPKEMDLLLSWYEGQNVTLEVLAEFHVRYENIHPFQDGNGRTGRLILFRECLRNDISPLIIEDVHRPEYLEALKEYRETKSIMKMVSLFQQEQDYYRNRCQYFMSE